MEHTQAEIDRARARWSAERSEHYRTARDINDLWDFYFDFDMALEGWTEADHLFASDEDYRPLSNQWTVDMRDVPKD